MRQRQGAVVDAAMTEGLARNAALDYERAARFKAANSNQVLLFHYDSLFDGSYLKKLSAFSPNIVCNPDKVWESNFVSKSKKKIRCGTLRNMGRSQKILQEMNLS